jgi:hypothetical protein
MNEYDYSSNFNQQDDDVLVDDHEPLFRRTGAAADDPQSGQRPSSYVDFAKPEIAALPRVLMMGPRRAGKTSIQVCVKKVIAVVGRCWFPVVVAPCDTGQAGRVVRAPICFAVLLSHRS